MGKIFTLTPTIKSVIQQALDDLITELGKPCTLVYPPRMISCSNCRFDPIGQKSSNHWLSGGPMQFMDGMACPLCNGAGRIAKEVTDPISLLCNWQPKHFTVPIPNLNLRAPNSVLEIKGYLTDLPRVTRASYLIFENAIDGIVRQKFQLISEGGDRSNIIQGRYFSAVMERMK